MVKGGQRLGLAGLILPFFFIYLTELVGINLVQIVVKAEPTVDSGFSSSSPQENNYYHEKDNKV